MSKSRVSSSDKRGDKLADGTVSGKTMSSKDLSVSFKSSGLYSDANPLI